MTIGQRIREIRKQRDKTLKDIADATGLSLPYLSDVERDRTQPSLKTLQRIAEGLEVTTTDLMNGVDDLGVVTDGALPSGLRELKEDPRWAGMLNDDWIKTLQKVDYRGRRPETKGEWLALFTLLRTMVEPEEE